MADHSINIVINSSGAEAGANRVSRSLDQIKRDAARVLGRGNGIEVGIDGSKAEAGASRVRRSLTDILRQAVGLKAISVGLDASGVQAGAGRATRSLRDLQAAASRLTDKSLSVKFDAAGLQEGVNRVSRSLRQLSDQAAGKPIKVAVDVAAVEAAVDRASRSLRGLSGQGAGVQIKVDTAAAESATERLKRSLSEIGRSAASTSIKVDTTQLDAAVNKASQSLRSLSGQGAGVKINVDTAAAEAATQRLRKSLSDIGGAAANVAIKVDSAGAEAGASKVRKSLRDIVDQAAKVSRLPINMDVSGVQASANTVKKSLREIQDEARKTSTGMNALGAVGSSIKGALGSIAAAFGAVEISKQIFDVTAKTQDLQTRFETLTGSAQSATETMKFLSDASNRLSVDTVKLADSYSKLLPMVKDGVLTTQQARDMMIGLTDAQKATGATTAQLEQAMFGLAQTLAMPKANIEQLNQVTEPIPGLLGAMDRAVGKLYPSAKKGAGAMRELVEAGKVSSQVFRDITIKALQEFDGAAEKTAGNLSSQSQRMKNAWNSLLNTIGQAVDEPLSWLIDKITLGINAIENGIKRLQGLASGLKESFDWTAPIASIQKAWEGATAANPSPLAAKGPAPSAAPKPTTASKSAALVGGDSKGGGGGKSKADNFAQDKREIEQQLTTQKALVDAYDRGRPAVEQYRNAMSDLSMEQRLNSNYSREQSDALMGLMQELKGLEELAAFKGQVASMTEQIQKIEGMAEAHREGAQAVRDAEAANNAYDSAVRLGMAGTQEAVTTLFELEQATQRANATLALTEELFQMDIDISSIQRLVDAFSEGGSAVRNAAIENEVYARSLQMGIDGDQAQVAALREKITALHDVQAAQAQAERLQGGEFDIEQMEGEIKLSQMVGEARYIEAERLDMLISKKRELKDSTATLTDEEERQAETLGRLNYQLNQQTSELQRLSQSIPNMAVAFDQAVSGGLLHFEDALVDIVTGAKSAREAFADMAKAIASDLARMAIRMAIIQPLMAMFGGGFGGGGGYVATGAPMSLVAHTGGVIGADSLPMRSIPTFHTGGVVGAGSPGRRSLPPMGDWNRYHSGGLAGNEVPAILQKGEGVFTKQQMAAMSPAGGGSSISMPITVNVSPEANTKDPAAAERQGKIISQQVQQAMDEHLRKNLRNGGLLNQSGY